MKKQSKHTTESGDSDSAITLIPGHEPLKKEVQFEMGRYQVLKSIGKGGMGEVFVAYDKECGRRIALKQIRSDLTEHPQLFDRFLTEARITCQLTHPSIIPIYEIHQDQDKVYYTMPFVEGETLKAILRRTRQQERSGEPLDPIGGSIPALIRIFYNICQAVAYAHVNQVIHRDLKPENIMIGKFGEVMILDWGLAKIIDQPETSETISPQLTKKTLLGKVVGTLSYMAPERAKGERATPQTDIYALGVILYQLLTLHLPFQRRSLKEFHEKMADEMAEHPTEVAPYRDVPHVLAQIALRCIEKDSQLRYDSVEELVHDLESYLEGRSEWFPIATLDIDHKEDWEFQENILFAEHTAITRQPEISDWFYLMISRQAFSENIKVEAEVHFDEECEGIGFLIGVPESAEREHLLDGYCLWIASDGQKRSQLFRNSVEAMVLDDVYIPKQTWAKVAIEKVENHIHVFFNDTHQFSYLSHLPIVGTHVGLIHKDTNFQIRNITVSVGSHSITVNCLAIPDAFLAQKDYQTALAEYRRIGYSFPGRQEGREALFRAGITLLEQAIHEEAPEKKQELYNQALEEFETLHQTPGAPLEYLGKGLVYQAQKEYTEEIKCFELAVRRYPHHPLMPILHEHILCRTQETSRLDRRAAYEYLLLVLRKLPPSVRGTQLEKMLLNLQKNWEPIHFLHPMPELGEKESWDLFCLPLAFWLQKTYVFQEMVDEMLAVTPKSTDTLFDAILCLILTKQEELALEAIEKNYEALQATDSQAIIDNLAFLKALASHNFQDCHTYFSNFDRHMSFVEETCLFFFLLWLLDRDRSNQVIELVGKINNHDPSPRYIRFRDTFLVWAHLLNKEWKEAGDILHSHPEEVLADEGSPLYFLHGCWLSFVESKDLGHVHLSGVQEATYPRTWTLAAHYLNGKLNETWEEKAFPWEKRFLYHQLHLYYTLQDNKTLAREFKNKLTKWPD